MEFNTLLKLIGSEPVFSSSFLLAGDVGPRLIRLQLSRWVKTKRIFQIRRGLYSIAPPYQKNQPHPFLVANHLQRASYVSLQSALAYFGLIPEVMESTTSVSTGRPERLETALGVFEFRHLKTNLLFGYRMLDLAGQSALVATPEKALLDLVYLQPGGESHVFLQELRLQNLHILDLQELKRQAQRFNTPKMHTATERIEKITLDEIGDYEDL